MLRARCAPVGLSLDNERLPMPKRRRSYGCGNPDPRPPGSPGWTVGKTMTFFYVYRPWSGPSCVQLLASWPSWLSAGEDQYQLHLDLVRKAQMKRETPHESGSQTHLFTDPELESNYPLVYEHLACCCWDDDPAQRRVTSTITFFGEPGCIKACLRDRAHARTAWVAGGSVADCFEALEAQLGSGTVQWRAERTEENGSAKRLKREKSP